MGIAPGAGARRGRRGARIALVAAAIAAGVLLLLSLLLHALLEPQRATGFLLDRIGRSLGLEIRTVGRAEYRLRGTPVLVLRGLAVREPGAATDLLRADRILLSVPWSTIRAGGDVLAARRLELDAPLVDVAALQHWLARRPPSKPQLPTFSDGIRIRDGRVAGEGWRIDGLQLDLPRLAAGVPAHARLRARFLDPPLAATADLAVAMMKPGELLRGASTGFAASGQVQLQQGTDWRLPGWLLLSGPLRIGNGGARLQPAKAGIAARWESGTTQVPFVLGAHGGLLLGGAASQLADATVVLGGRGAAADDPVPPLRARGQLALGRRLVLRLEGEVGRWPGAWPALPAPLDAADAAMPFSLDYTGTPDLADAATLALQRGGAALDARFRLADVQDWLADDRGNPLPPLDARLRVPRLDLDGVRLEGVEASLASPGAGDGPR